MISTSTEEPHQLRDYSNEAIRGSMPSYFNRTSSPFTKTWSATGPSITLRPRQELNRGARKPLLRSSKNYWPHEVHASRNCTKLGVGALPMIAICGLVFSLAVGAVFCLVVAYRHKFSSNFTIVTMA